MTAETAPSPDAAKRAAAAAALDLVEPGMRLGLGTGSTARHFVALLGERVAAGLNVICVPTSEETRAQAESLNIPLATIDEQPELDLTVDGADEFDAALRLVKGGGGALLREKIVASASRRMVVIADSSKFVATLGRFPLPVEVTRFGLEATRRAILKAAEATGAGGDIAAAPARRQPPSSATMAITSSTAISPRSPSLKPRPRASAPFPASSSTGCSSASPAPSSARAPAASRFSANSTRRSGGRYPEIYAAAHRGGHPHGRSSLVQGS